MPPGLLVLLVGEVGHVGPPAATLLEYGEGQGVGARVEVVVARGVQGVSTVRVDVRVLERAHHGRGVVKATG